MAIFASTTTSGYSDPLKAMSIKALEARMKDQMAQAAAQQPDAAMMATIPGGIGHVLGVVGDKMSAARNEQAAAEGRNELAATIAQGPKGADGNWSPEQLAVMARRDPEQMSKFFQNQHEKWTTNRTEDASTGRTRMTNDTNIATNKLTNETSAANTAAEIAGRRDVVTTQEAGSSGRLSAQLGSEEARQRERLAAEEARQGSSQTHEANQLRLKSELEDAQKQKDYFQQNRRDDKANEQQERITRLTSELASGENRKKEEHEKGLLNTKLAQDTEMQNLQRQMTRENVAAQIAGSKGDNEARIAAEDRRQQAQLKWDERKQTLANEHAEDMAEDAAGHKYELQKRELASASEIANAKIKAEGGDPVKVAKALELQKQLSQKQLLVSEFERAEKDLDHPGGIHIGSTADLKTGASNWLGIGSKAKAERTTRVNNAMNQMAVASMADTLTGPSTNFELTKFREMKNNPNVGWDALKDQYKKVLAVQRKDTESTARAVDKTGGNSSDPTKPAAAAPAPAASAGGGGPPRPAGKNDSALIAEAEAAKANATPEQKAAIDRQLQQWLMPGGAK